MIGQEGEFHLPHPNPVEYRLVRVPECHIEEDGRLDDLSIAGMRDIEVEVYGVFGEGIDAEGQRLLHHFLNALAIREDLVDTDREHL